MTTAVNMQSVKTCVNPGCGASFVANERWLNLGNGLCRKCAAQADSVERRCSDCGNTFKEYPKFLTRVGAFAGIRQRCPGCHDKHEGKALRDTVESRECLGYFPLVKVADFDFEPAPLCQAHDISGRPPVKANLKDRRNKSYSGSLTVYDYRADGARGIGSLASVRVMKVRHAAGVEKTVMSGTPLGPKHEETLQFSPEFVYLVLEPVDEKYHGMEPEVQLVCVEWTAKWNQSGGVSSDRSHFSVTLTSQSRSGRHSHGTLVALVDDGCPVLYRQDNLQFRRGLGAPELEEPAFRDGSGVQPSLLIPGGDVMLADRYGRDGWRVKLVDAGVVIRPKRMDDGRYEIPTAVEGAQLQLVASEAGGGYTNTGWACCVAGLGGEVLTPIATAGDRGDLACGVHGWFAVTGGLVTAETCWWNKSTPEKSVKLVRHTIAETGEPGVVTLAAETVFTGVPGELPEALMAFLPVVEASARKASDYHCRALAFRA